MMQDKPANCDSLNTFISVVDNNLKCLSFIKVLVFLQSIYVTFQLNNSFFSYNVFLFNPQVTVQITLQFRSIVYILCITLGWGFTLNLI